MALGVVLACSVTASFKLCSFVSVIFGLSVCIHSMTVNTHRVHINSKGNIYLLLPIQGNTVSLNVNLIIQGGDQNYNIYILMFMGITKTKNNKITVFLTLNKSVRLKFVNNFFNHNEILEKHSRFRFIIKFLGIENKCKRNFIIFLSTIATNNNNNNNLILFSKPS